MIKHIDKKDVPMEIIITMLDALKDSTRQDILYLFRQKSEYCVNDIAGSFKLSRPAISHHLNIMKRAKILSSRKEGKFIYFSFNKKYVVGMLEQFLHYIKDCC